jgi:Tfp pilus assembly protein PilV
MKRRGFSVFELILAAALLTIGLVSLINAFSIGLTQGSGAKDLMLAKNLAESKLEEIRNISYANVVSESKAVIPGSSGYQRQVQIVVVQPGLKQIRIDVFWPAKNNEASISLHSLVSDI